MNVTSLRRMLTWYFTQMKVTMTFYSICSKYHLNIINYEISEVITRGTTIHDHHHIPVYDSLIFLGHEREECYEFKICVS